VSVHAHIPVSHSWASYMQRWTQTSWSNGGSPPFLFGGQFVRNLTKACVNSAQQLVHGSWFFVSNEQWVGYLIGRSFACDWTYNQFPRRWLRLARWKMTKGQIGKVVKTRYIISLYATRARHTFKDVIESRFCWITANFAWERWAWSSTRLSKENRSNSWYHSMTLNVEHSLLFHHTSISEVNASNWNSTISAAPREMRFW
jgi:hypothetical protein